MPRGKATDPELVAQVLGQYLAGETVTALSEQHNLPIQTVSTWVQSAQFGEVRSKKDIGELTRGYLEKLLEGLTTQVEHVSTKDYISKQSASDVAVLHGVMADKAFRLLSAAIAAAGVGNASAGNQTEPT